MSKFYIVDAKTGENRGPVVMDLWDDISVEKVYDQSSREYHQRYGKIVVDDDITDEEYDQIAEDAENERIHSLIEASAEINELRGDCKKMLERLMLTTAALGIALRDYRGPYRKELQQRRDEAEDMFAHMFQYYGEDLKNEA